MTDCMQAIGREKEGVGKLGNLPDTEGDTGVLATSQHNTGTIARTGGLLILHSLPSASREHLPCSGGQNSKPIHWGLRN